VSSPAVGDLAMIKTCLQAFLIRRTFSKDKNGWLTWEGSNLHIPNPERTFETFKESALIFGNLGLEDLQPRAANLEYAAVVEIA
jgi:hypothetical protein